MTDSGRDKFYSELKKSSLLLEGSKEDKVLTAEEAALRLMDILNG